MKTQTKTEEHSINELAEMRQRIAELEEENTERKRVEESLRGSEEYYQSLVENAQDAIVIMNSDATIRYESPSMERMTGRKIKDRIGKNPFEFLHPDDTTKVMEALRQLLENKIPTAHTELRLQHKDGTWRTFEVVGNNLLDNPAVTGIVLNLHDVTERKRAEEALRESEEKLRVMFESTSEGIAVTDLKGKILDVNDAILRMSGLSREELVGQEGFALMPREDAKGIIGQGKNAIKSETGKAKMSQEITPTYGRSYDVDLSMGVLRDSSGEPTGFVAIVRDVTERKRTEEELRRHREHLEELVEERTKELQDAQVRLVRSEKLAVIGQLAGGVSHELRNPLGAIKNASYFLNMAIEQPEQEVKETLEILEKEVATSERIISSLLEFARPKPATLQNVHINEVIEESLCRVTVPENVKVVRHLDETLPIILADPGQLGQVFINIILNAIQAMPEGGQLVIKSEVPGPKWVDVSFTDTGVGIPKENMRKLFEPLFTTKAKGIGLGLAICRTMVEEHGGTIELQSIEGKGSTFTISLPVGKKEEQ